MYCVYLTYYRGDILPHWYIGSSTIKNVLNGYNGSIKSVKYKSIYQSEQRKNKHLFTTSIISEHLTRKEALQKEYDLQKHYNVIKNDKFMNEAYAAPNGFFGRKLSDKDKQHMVKQRLKNGLGDYHNGKNPFKNKDIIQKCKDTLLKKTQIGDVSKYNKIFDIVYKGKRFYSIKSMCEYINFSEKLIRNFLKINNITFLTDEIIDNILFLKNLEPSKKWLYRNILLKDGLKYFLYYKLEIPKGYKMLKKHKKGLE